MFAITGITGRVGGAVGQNLMGAGRRVRAIVRDEAKGRPWMARGAQVAIASLEDPRTLARAVGNAEGVFVMMPPNYDPMPDFPDTRARAETIKTALNDAQPGRVVFLSTVGAQVSEPNLLNNSKLTEEYLRTVSVPVAFLRAAWFMENAASDVAAARAGVIPSFLDPLDHAIPMVAIADIARIASELLQEDWKGVRVVEVEGPRRYSANDIAAAFSTALGQPVRTEAVPRDTWEALFRAQGMRNPTPRMRMIDGFNQGWIDFERTGERRIGTVTLDEVIGGLVARS